MIKIIPAGGVMEIGMNMSFISCNGKNICVDSGIIFPNSPYLGIETLMPDYSELTRTLGDIEALFITHGHEDHIGGIPYLLQKMSPKIYAAPYAVELIKAKCKRNSDVNPKKNLRTIDFGTTIKEDPFNVEYIHVDHSIPDSGALFIEAGGVNILYASDFKLGEKYTNNFLSRLDSISKNKGIDLLLSDSTNAFENEIPLPDSVVKENLDDCFSRATKKIIVTLFSSNLERINQVIALSKKHKKNLFVSGNNLKIHMGIGRKLGYIEDDEGCLKPESSFSKYDESNSVFLCTGSQAERNSAIVRLSHGYHPQIEIKEKDMIIFSSSKIPGNEKIIMDTINRLSEKGAEIVFPDENVHCSGHAHSEDLAQVIKTANPKFFVPIHGEYLHLKEHIEIAKQQGIKPHNCFILKGGSEFSLTKSSAKISGSYEIKKLYVDSDSGSLIDKTVVKSRMLSGLHGVLFVSLAIDKKGKILNFLNAIKIDSTGMADNKTRDDIIKNSKKEIMALIKHTKLPHGGDELKTEIRNIVRRAFKKHYQDKPEVLVQILKI